MTLSNNYGKDPVSQRKEAVRKHSRQVQVGVGLGAVAGVAAAVFSATTFWLILAVVGFVYAGYHGLQIKKIIEHKDQW